MIFADFQFYIQFYHTLFSLTTLLQTRQKFTVNVWKKSCRILILNSLGKVDILKFLWKLKILAKSVSRLNLKGTGSLRSENSLF